MVEQLTEVMARVPAGDVAAMETLYIGFGDPIRSFIRTESAARGLGDRAADVDGLTLDVCSDLFRRAGS